MRQHHYRRRTKDAPELDVTTFMNLMVVLVPFLLITAVFSRITIVELDLPSSSGGPTSREPNFRPEVVVREDGLEITNGQQIIAAMPKVDDEYDLATLSEYMLELKREYPDVSAASVLLEPQIPYDYLVRVMDVVRSAEIEWQADATGGAAPLEPSDGEVRLASGDIPVEGVPGLVRVALFPDISIGEAP
jgi:biopolymer transport protein ExbD